MNDIENSNNNSIQSIGFFEEIVLPVPLPTSDNTIEIFSRRSLKSVSDFVLVFGLWYEKKHIKQHTYENLQKILLLINDLQVRDLPKKLSILFTHCCRQLSFLTI